MKTKEFIRGLMAYIKAHYQHPDAVFLKESLKFKEERDTYGELVFSYSTTFEGVTLHISIDSKEMVAFFAANYPQAYRQSAEFPYTVFVQNSIQGAHYFQAPPITSYPHGDAIKLPETETEAEPIYADVLQHLQQHYIAVIHDIHAGNANVLKYLAAYPSAFWFKALTADFIIRRNGLTARDKLVQDLFAFDDKVTANENGLFSPHDLIFMDNEFDQKLKEQITQR